MKKVEFRVITNTVSQVYQIKAVDPAFQMYDGMYNSIASLMSRITEITKLIRAKNKAKAVFTFE